MDSQSLRNQKMNIILQRLQRESLEQMQKRRPQTCTCACHCLHHYGQPHLLRVPRKDHNTPMLDGSLQPLRAGVAPGRREQLAPITPAPLQQQQQQQQQPCSSSSSLPTCVQGQDPVLMNLLLGDRLPKAGGPRPLGMKNLAGLDRAHPLKPLNHLTTLSGVASGGMAPAPPAVAKATDKSLNKSKEIKARRSVKSVQDVGLKTRGPTDNSGQAKVNAAQSGEEQVAECGQESWMLLRQEALDLAEEIRLASLGCSSVLSGDASVLSRTGSSVGSLSPVDLRTPSVLRALPFLRTPIPPSAPTLPAAPSVSAAPAPPQKAKPQAANLRQFRSSLPRLKKTTSLNVATAVTEHKSEESLEARKKEEVRACREVKKKPVRVVKQTSKPQQTRELPELAKLPPLACPEQAILQAFRLLREDDWNQKIKALISIRSLSQHHAEVLLPRLHDVCLAVNREVKNLRSMVSCAAMETLACLHAHLGRDMDAEAEGTAQTLLPKAGEASRFIKEDVELALGCMVLNVTPSRSMNALINTGLRHRNAAVRKITAKHLEKLAEVMGASRVLCGKKDLTDRFIHSISCLAMDSAQEVRTHARNTLAFLASHPDLIEMVDKFVPQRDQAPIKDVINKCQKRNLH